MNHNTFISHSPCIQCGKNGIDYDENNEFCKSCSYYILVHSLGKVLMDKTDCEYCKYSLLGVCDSENCNFEVDIDKLFSRYMEKSLTEDDSDNSNIELKEELVKDDEIFSSNRFSNPYYFLKGFEAWLEEEDDPYDWR